MSKLRIKDAPLLQDVDGTEKIPTGGKGDFSVTLDQVKTFARGGLPQQLEDHINDTSNPHQVTKDQVGLGNADNTSDVDKPVSTATQAALDLKADKTAVHSKSLTLPTYYTKEVGVNPVTGVTDGAYFNVRSTDEDTMLVEYQNVGGSAVETGKRYLSALGVQQQEKPASTIKDASGKDQQEINDGQVRLDTILNKTGTTETLAESVDATPFLQALISAMSDGMTLDLLGKTFRVKKNTGFSSDYPKGDQPCLFVKDKKNVRITNGKLIVKEHGQGCFDVLRGSVTFDSLVIQGAGNFPPLDGDTGRGEKSTAGTGWFDATFYNNGDPRNNSINTSGYSTGGFGGNFPQWGGGTASTWGMWNGGYIRNYGTAIYCLDSKVDVYNCELHGFNGSGVDAVGTADVVVERCRIHNNYSCGVWAKAYGDGANKIMPSLIIHNNDIYDIGHPDAKHTDQNIDPGYGVATSNTSSSTVGLVNFTATSNRVYRCKRKGIEAHHATNWFVHDNSIESSGLGISININSGHHFETAIITKNKVKSIYYTTTGTSTGIGVAGLSDSNNKGSVIINSNEVVDVGIPIDPSNPSIVSAAGRSISVGSVASCIITNNKVCNNNALGHIGINTGVSSTLLLDDSVINGNIVKGYFKIGIFDKDRDANSSHICSSNTVDLISTQPFISGEQIGIQVDLAETAANKIKVPSDFAGNKRLVSTAAPTKGISDGRVICIRVAFNGTANPTLAGSSGTDYISSVVSDAFGLAVVLKNVNTNVILLGVDFNTSPAPSTGVTSLGYTYQRSFMNSTGGVIGFKASSDAETHISAASLTSGSMDIKLLIF